MAFTTVYAAQGRNVKHTKDEFSRAAMDKRKKTMVK